MQSKVCILGGKPMEKIVLEYSKNFDTRVRVNCNVQGDIDLEKDQFYLNNHVYNNFVKTNKSLEKIKNFYKYANKGILEKMFSVIKKVIKKPISQRESGINTFSNKFLKSIGCKKLFKKAPRCGYQAILHYIKFGINPVICGFTISEYEKHKNHAVIKKPGNCHDFLSEIDLLKELHLMDKIDITPCMLESFSLPLLDCDNLQPKKPFIEYCLNNSGVCILKNIQNISSILKYFENGFKLVTKNGMWEKKDFDQYIITKPEEEVKIIKSTEILDYKNLSDEMLSKTEVKVQKNTKLIILIKAGTIYKY